MRNIILILTILVLLAPTSKVLAQNNTICKALPLDVTKNSTSGQMVDWPALQPFVDLPCNQNDGTVSPIVYSFRPSGSHITFTVVGSNYANPNIGIGLAVDIFEASVCSSASIIDCKVGSSITFSLNVNPCTTYYIYSDCLFSHPAKVTIYYNKSDLLATFPKPNISGSKTICKNSSAKFCANSTVSGCEPPSYKWTLSPSSAGTIAAISGDPGCANVKITNPPSSGKVQVCAEPVFTGKSIPSTIKGCMDIEVLDLKQATCDVNICAEQRPYNYDITECIRSTNPSFLGTVTPPTFTVNLPPGTKKTQTVNYTLDDTGCTSSVKLNMEVFVPKTINFPPLLLCEGETANIKGNDFSCADASPALKTITKLSANKPLSCDTSFKMLVQCLKITPKITGLGALDCSNTQVTLNAASSITLPQNINSSTFQGLGSRQYAWSKNGVPIPNATLPTLVVTQAGTYELTVTYSYQVTQNVNGQQGVWTKSCSKSTSVQIIGSSTSPIAETPLAPALSCANQNAIFTITPDPNASYHWTTSAAASIIGSTNNPNMVTVLNNSMPYQVCLEKTACQQTSAANCISITPIAVPAKPVIVGPSPVCLGDSAFYEITNPNSSSAQFSWSVSNGQISHYNVDSTQVFIKWSNLAGIGKIKVKVMDLCGSAEDSIAVIIKSCNTRSAGRMALKHILTSSKINKTITAKHLAGTENLKPGDAFAFVLHEGSANQIVKMIDINQTGRFGFDSTKMKLNRVYYVSYVVGPQVSGLPNLQDANLALVPKGQAIGWFIKINKAEIREGVNSPPQIKDFKLNIYPNPAEDRLFIQVPSNKLEMNLCNMQGQVVFTQSDFNLLSTDLYQVRVGDLPRGMYLLKISTLDKTINSKVILR